MQVMVSVGTDHHPFDRLVDWASRWAAEHPDDEVVIQFGDSTPPSAGQAHRLFDRTTMGAQIRAADLVVISCGPGGVMDVRATGRLPVVMARRGDLGEHVDDHQAAFAEHLDSVGLARRIESEADFRQVLLEAAEHPRRFRVEIDNTEPSGIATTGRLIDELVRGT